MARYFGTNLIAGDLPTFTQAQIDSINSGITDIEVASYNTHINNSTIHVTSTDKTNWNAKQDAITGAATTITSDNLTASRAVTSNSNGKIDISDTTSTELSYVHGVTSAIQTQLDAKAIDSDVVHKSGDETITGVKRFTSLPAQKNTSMDRTTTPTADGMCAYRFTDTNDRPVGEISLKRFNGDNTNYMMLYTCENGTDNADIWYEVLKAYHDTTNNRNVVVSEFFQGTAQYSNWADLAEQYQSDQKYSVGTLIKFGGEKDITIANDKCNGVISDKPGFVLDAELKDSQPVALVGKTPIRIIGKVNKFDNITLSEVSGVGRVAKEGEKIIAKALENSDNENEKLVLCVTKFNLD